MINKGRSLASLKSFNVLGYRHVFSPRTVVARSAMAAAGDVTAVANEVLTEWFGENYLTVDKESAPAPEMSKKWFVSTPEFDKMLMDKFGADVRRVGDGEYDAWVSNPYNGLAAVILADQFPRNIFRGTAESFSLDPKARTIAKALLDSGLADQLARYQRGFLYLPFMHSEALEDQEFCVRMYEEEVKAAGAGAPALGMLNGFLQYAKAHRDVVARWGRFPHRNAILGRANTPEEEEGLKAGTIAKF